MVYRDYGGFHPVWDFNKLRLWLCRMGQLMLDLQIRPTHSLGKYIILPWIHMSFYINKVTSMDAVWIIAVLILPVNPGTFHVCGFHLRCTMCPWLIANKFLFLSDQKWWLRHAIVHPPHSIPLLCSFVISPHPTPTAVPLLLLLCPYTCNKPAHPSPPATSPCI